MGTWGAGLLDDDLAADVQATFEEAVEAGASPVNAADRALREFRELAADLDEGPVLWLALASLLLDHGVGRHPALDRAREIIRNGEGLDRWRESGDEALAERRAVYGDLAARLEAPQKN